MSHLVSDFLINPVLRQARRFSRSNTAGDLDSLSNQEALPDNSHETAVDGATEGIENLNGLEMTGDEVVGDTGENIPGALSPSSHGEENGAVEGGSQRPEVGRIPGTRPTSGNSNLVPPRLNTLLSDPGHIDTDVSDNSSFGLSDSLSRMSPAEGPSRRATQESSQSVPASRCRNNSLPADDGMSALRQQIIRIQAMEVPAEQKARMMHELMTQGYYGSQEALHAKSQPRAPSPTGIISQERPSTSGPLSSFLWQINGGSDGPPSNQQHTFHLSVDDLKRTYAPLDPPEADEDGIIQPMEEVQVLGCQHYKRNVKLQCSTCDRWYTCRMCHDEVEDHILIRHATKNMLCMICGYAQPAGEFCAECGERTAWYYCNVCKLWDNDPNKNIYHCNDCGICRKGRGLGKDFFHCKTCGVCMSVSVERSHKCIERVSDCDCPICGEYMFTSPRPVVFMLCGHSIHQACYYEHMKTSYKCPICSKSTVNMATQFRNLDRAIDNQPMPPQFRDTKAMVSCNDCYAKSAVKYHWLGLKCAICDSYNTVQLSILSDPAVAVPPIENRETESRAALGQAAGESTSSTHLAPVPTRSRRHSLHATTPAVSSEISSSLQRMARSVSPARGAGFFDNAMAILGGETDDSGGEDDELDFWGRDEIRSSTSAENIEEDLEDNEDSEDDSASAVDDCDDEGEDEDEFELLGHR